MEVLTWYELQARFPGVETMAQNAQGVLRIYLSQMQMKGHQFIGTVNGPSHTEAWYIFS